MAISQKLHTKLVQKLILTPSLQQAIKLLPMSTLELSELLNQEMVENPMLEEVPTEELQPVEAAQEKQEEKPAPEKGDTWDDQDYEYFFGDYLDDGYRPRTPTEVKELPPIENTLSSSASLSDHLLWQLSMQSDEPLVREIGEAIIGNLDDDGQLVATVEELSAMGPWTTEDVERALRVVQGFDPIGVAARDLQECLLLQLRHLGMGGTPAERIVTEHMRLLQNHQVPELARKLGMSIDDLKQHIELIRHLDPKPGSRLNPSQSQYVIPDVYVVKVEDQYVAVLNEEGLPQLRISPVYRRLLDKTATENTDETRAYVKDKFRSALRPIKSVEQRQKTIHKVATSIINFQRDFLDHGIEYLRPLVLRDVANDIGMHESTVSRVVTNKYMHTPQGVFEMKYFFHSGIASSYGEAVSSVTIKQRIRKIIEQEDPRKPLSDSKIVSILQREGLELARRTIAKYREELKIPTSNQRKVLYELGTAMRLELTGRHVKITPAIRAIVEDGLAHSLRKLNSSVVSVQVVLTQEKSRVHVDATLHAKGDRFLHGEAIGRDPATAVSAVLDKIDRQAQRVKNKWADGKRRGVSPAKAGSAAPRPEAAARLFGDGAPAPASGPRVMRVRRYPIKRMSVEEAALVVGDTTNSFVLFRESDTQALTIVFRRPDGNVGLIEPEIAKG